jgi:hypothetical protein
MNSLRLGLASLLFAGACSSGHAADSDGGNPPPNADGGPADAMVPVSFGAGGTWAFDEARGTSASGDPLAGAPQWTVGKVGTALHLGGTADSVETTQPALDGSKSFSTAAWVQLDRVDQPATFLALNGQHASGFTLGFEPGAGGQPGGFSARFAASDAEAATVAHVDAPFAPVADVWFHVAASYDASAKTARLYVNGRKVGEASVPATFAATGHTSLGRGLAAGAPARFLAGTLDEVRLVDSAMSDGDVAALAASAATITPVRPPSVPLIVRGPYVSTWMPADAAPGHWPTFWTGAVKAITGFVRVDGTPYNFIGAPPGVALAQQLQLEITSTQSRYVFAAGGVNLYVDFVSPVDADDLKKLSVPFGYIQVQAVSVDGQAHATSVYLDISGEWAHGDAGTSVNWNREDVSATPATISAFSIRPASASVLGEANDYASWGTAIFATASPGVSFQAGADGTVRGLFLGGGVLDGSIDTQQPRAISDRWPVVAFESDLGMLGGKPSAPRVFALGNVRQPAVSYLGTQVPPLWQSYWASWQAMLAEGFGDMSSGALVARADALDRKIAPVAVKMGGAKYAALCALALRQAFGGVELVNSQSDPWLMLKEISSNGNMQTVDVIYPSMPAFLYVAPKLVRLLLTPHFEYAESGHWPQPFAQHDLGASYPNATAHDDGGGENMPVEESANMVLMAAAYLDAAADADAKAYCNAHYATLKKWSDYLVDNTLDPGFQNQTDDFTGFIAHSSNLALKGILAVGAMGKIARTLGKTADADHYDQVAHAYITEWSTRSQDAASTHLKLAYDGGDETWSLKYNAYPDRLLGLGLIPAATLAEESAWYVAQRADYGFPLDNRHTYTKGDWEMWTAAGVSDPALRQAFIDTLYRFADTTPSRVPLTDWYDTHTGLQAGFQARPVIGGLFSLMTLHE